MKNGIFVRVLLAVVLVVFSGVALARYPEKPIRLVVSFPPGSSTDMIARAIAEPLEKKLGQPVVIENRPGAEGYVGAISVANATPDGYTLIVAPTGVFATPLLRNKSRYDPIKSFTAIGRIGDFAPSLLVVSQNNTATTMRHFLSEVTRGNSFQGTGNIAGVLAGEQLKTLLTMQATQVSYPGEPQSLLALLSGQVTWMFVLPTVAKQHIDAGSVRALATTGSKRDSFFPDVPTLAESDAKLAAWQEIGSLVGLLGPAGMQPEVVETLSRALADVLTQQDVQAKLRSMVFLTASSTPVELSALIAARVSVWKTIIETSRIPKVD